MPRFRPPRRERGAARLAAVIVSGGLAIGVACSSSSGAARGGSPGVPARSQPGGTSSLPLSSPSRRDGPGPASPIAQPSPGTASPTPVPRPAIVSMPIPFGPGRRMEMAAYARRHYGIASFRLIAPKVIVEHFTASATFGPVFAEFSRDVPDPELHELPGLCAHFVIDRDGTIYQLVPLDLMCRHTVGLNYTAIGIEDVGTSDREVLDDPRQLSASLRLTLWLMSRFRIQLRNVIGHNESLTSPYHRELVAAFRCQTHGDWSKADMDVYRDRLARLARRYRLPLGPPARPVSSGC